MKPEISASNNDESRRKRERGCVQNAGLLTKKECQVKKKRREETHDKTTYDLDEVEKQRDSFLY